jgi:hypothetical protein
MNFIIPVFYCIKMHARRTIHAQRRTRHTPHATSTALYLVHVVEQCSRSMIQQSAFLLCQNHRSCFNRPQRHNASCDSLYYPSLHSSICSIGSKPTTHSSGPCGGIGCWFSSSRCKRLGSVQPKSQQLRLCNMGSASCDLQIKRH